MARDQRIDASGTADAILGAAAPRLSLPKGGGSVRGIGETFSAQTATGSGRLQVPVAVSPGRAGFGPTLHLAYDSGAGLGPFGLGWTLSAPGIHRRTDKRLPSYDDNDVFSLAGVEDLTPTDAPDVARVLNGRPYQVRVFRPRVEGGFARIERWASASDAGDMFWRTISRDNQTTWFGRTPESRISDPTDPSRIFSWLPCEVHDDRGNVMSWRYKAENDQGVDLSASSERNRDGARTTNRYLKRILYGARTPYYPDHDSPAAAPLPGDWAFELVFDYGEHAALAPLPEVETSPWPVRPDPFSSYRAGFEVRTYRLCRRILMFHHVPEGPEVGATSVVRSTDLTYGAPPAPGAAPDGPFYSTLQSVLHTSWRRSGEGYVTAALPPLEFTYSTAQIDETVRELAPDALPEGVDGRRLQWIDLDAEGLPGVLSEDAGGWFYRPNLSAAPAQAQPLARFGAQRTVSPLPAIAALAAGNQRLIDLAGDGQLDLAEFDGPRPGFHERDAEGGWSDFHPFENLPRIYFGDPDLRFVDLTGDGRADLLISEDEALFWHESLGEAGFGPRQGLRQALDEEAGPRLVFSDTEDAVFLADMCGDGLLDLVRVREGEVCYWPNLGRGRFGAKVAMDGAPQLGAEFDPRRVQLADIDGSGTSDLIYFGPDDVLVAFNQCGESWQPPRRLTGLPCVDGRAHATVTDLLGAGTACLVWSSPLPADARRPMRYLNLMCDPNAPDAPPVKPHLLVRIDNNLGAETLIDYAPSTRFYLADKLTGRPWATRLPFPVQVVERVTVLDHISRNRFTSRYAYHHGHYDGVEREFHGFGMVEQWDAEAFGAFNPKGDAPAAAAVNEDPAHSVPPILTRRWFHTGQYEEAGPISTRFAAEYYREGDAGAGLPGLDEAAFDSLLLPDTVLTDTVLTGDGTRQPHALTGEEARQACRALKGQLLRQEVYGLDGTDAADRPYTVSEHNYTVELLQPQGTGPYPVFLVHPRETVELDYERRLYKTSGGQLVHQAHAPPDAKDAADPRTSHTLVLKVDAFGNVLRSAAIAYGRRFRDPELTPADQDRQQRTLAVLTDAKVTNAAVAGDAWRTPLVFETAAWELVNPLPPGAGRLISFEQVGQRIASAAAQPELPFEDVSSAGAAPAEARLRLLKRSRTLFRPDDFGTAADNARALLPAGKLQPLAVAGESYHLAFTPTLLAKVLERDGAPLLADVAAVLTSRAGDGAGHVDLDGDGRLWIPSGRVFLHPDTGASPGDESTQARAHFFLARRFEDPFGASGTVAYDPLNLLPVETVDAAGNRITAVYDYRVLAPRQITDANGNVSLAAFDTLGLIAGSAVQGKPGEGLGDRLDGFDPDPPGAAKFLDADDPRPLAAGMLGQATSRLVYDLDRFRRSRAEAPDDPTRWRPTAVAHIAREAHASEPVPAGGLRLQVAIGYSDGLGRTVQSKLQADPGPLVDGGPDVPRWIASGWTVFDNKGQPVRRYEPFFTGTAQFEFGVKAGVSPVLFYDPAGRPLAILHADDSYEKTVLDPWRSESWDNNDTVELDPRTDPDTAAWMQAYFAAQPPGWSTWLQAKAAAPAGSPQADAAAKARGHSGTPSRAYFDALGRPFLTVAHNRFQRAGATVEERYLTRTVLDVGGEVVELHDALGRTAVRYAYDLAGARLRQSSMDGGERWMLPDAHGQPIRAWSSRGYQTRSEYDLLRRPLRALVSGGNAAEAGAEAFAGEILCEQTIYGDSAETGLSEDERVRLNLRGRVFRHYDHAGVATHLGVNPALGSSQAYDFKGNLLRWTRQFAQDHRSTPNWSQAPALSTETFSFAARYDALNRVVEATTPDGSVCRPGFNEAGQLKTVDARLRGAAAATSFVTAATYDAKGQRTSFSYGCGARTDYAYDPQTFRLTRLTTARGPGHNGTSSQLFEAPQTVQDLIYAYDPVGNIPRIEDAALKTTLNGQMVEPASGYTYDAVYRLTDASGREHIGQSALDRELARHGCRDLPFVGASQLGDLQALRNYTEHYDYDAAGNLLVMRHVAVGGNWTRTFAVAEKSPLDPGQICNRLSGSSLTPDGAPAIVEPHAYDASGNMTSAAHLTLMGWNFREELRATSRQVVIDPSPDLVPETTYYVYDAAGQRARKVTERADGTLKCERIYLGGYEVYREFAAGAVRLERQTLHMMDDRRRIAMVETQTVAAGAAVAAPAPATRYQLSNHVDSACLELDETGALISYEEYSPYGATTFQAGRSAAEVSLKRYRYTGTERDDETGFAYHGARYYAPWLARWISVDPLGVNGGLNLYGYAFNCPTRLIDPGGTQAHPEDTDTHQVWVESHSGSSAAPSPPSAKVEQLYLSDQLKQRVRATRSTPGFDEHLRTDMQKASDAFGPGGKTDVLHPNEKPFALTMAGEESDVRPGAASPNRIAGATRDKAAVQAARSRGEPTRTNGHDLSAPKAVRAPRPPKAPWRVRVRAWKGSVSGKRPVPEGPPAVVKPAASTQLKLPHTEDLPSEPAPPVAEPPVQARPPTPAVEPPVTARPEPSPGFLEGITGKLAGPAAFVGGVLSVKKLAEDLEMHFDPSNPALGPVGTHRTDSLGTVWIKIAKDEWVTEYYYHHNMT